MKLEKNKRNNNVFLVQIIVGKTCHDHLNSSFNPTCNSGVVFNEPRIVSGHATDGLVINVFYSIHLFIFCDTPPQFIRICQIFANQYLTVFCYF